MGLCHGCGPLSAHAGNGRDTGSDWCSHLNSHQGQRRPLQHHTRVAHWTTTARAFRRAMDCRPSNLSVASFSVSMRLSMEVVRRWALASLQAAAGEDGGVTAGLCVQRRRRAMSGMLEYRCIDASPAKRH